MILGLIIVPLCMLGAGYLYWKSSTIQQDEDGGYEVHNPQSPELYLPEQGANYPPGVVEGEVGKMLNQLVEHMHAYEQYWEEKTWGNHIGRKMCAECMTYPEGSVQRIELRIAIIQYITEYNKYLKLMETFSHRELTKAWEIALKLRGVAFDNPQLTERYEQCWDNIVPHVVTNGYTHPSLNNYIADRNIMAQELRQALITRREEYAATHKEQLEWEQAYAQIRAAQVIEEAEQQAFIEEQVANDYAIAVQLSERWIREARYDQVVAEHNMPRVEPYDPAMGIVGADNVPPHNVPPHQQNHPPGAARGGWFAEFVEWIISFFM